MFHFYAFENGYAQMSRKIGSESPPPPRHPPPPRQNPESALIVQQLSERHDKKQTYNDMRSRLHFLNILANINQN